MAISTTYTCDRCGRSQDKAEQMWQVQVSFYHYGQTPRYGAGLMPQALWCRKCCEEFDCLLGKHLEPKADAAPQKTLDDFVREMVQEELASIERS